MKTRLLALALRRRPNGDSHSARARHRPNAREEARLRDAERRFEDERDIFDRARAPL